MLLNTLDVPYGLVTGAEPKKAWFINCVEGGEALISDLREEKAITDDEVNALRLAIAEARLENMANIFKKILQFPLPEEFLPSYDFTICTETNCPRPLIHGSVCDKNNNGVTKNTVSVLTDGFAICDGLAQLGGTSTLEGIRLFQQMLAANLPINKTDWYELYKTLPEETRCNYEEVRGEMILKELFERLKHPETIFTDN